MSDELRIKVVLDNGDVKEGFLSLEKQADKTAKKVGQSFDKKGSNLDSLSEGIDAANGGFASMAQLAARAAGPVGGLALAISGSAAAAFQMALAGEQVNAINTQFANVATSAGLAADQFGQSIITATQGLIDDEDALKIATQGIIALGDQASKIPAIMDAARGASRALGKDFKTTFEDLSTFVEFGNARVLRNYGIVLDLEKAYAAAAKSIGVATSALTEQQKQQVRANLVLDEVPTKFGAAAASVTPLKDALDRLKVSSGNAVDGLAVSLNSTLGPALERTLNYFSTLAGKGISAGDALNLLLNPLTTIASGSIGASAAAAGVDKMSMSVDELKKKAAIAQDELSKVNDVLQILRESKANASGSAVAMIDAEIESVSLKAKAASKNVAELYSIISTKSGAEDLSTVMPTGQKPDSEVLKRTAEQSALVNAERIKKEQEYTTFLLNEQTKRIQTEIQLKQLSLTEDMPIDQQKLINKQIYDQQVLLQETQNQLNLQAVKKQFQGTELIDIENKNAAILQTEETNNQSRLLATAKFESDKLKLQKKFDAQGFAATSTALGQIATLQDSSSEELAAVGKAAAITKATIDGYTAVQSALANVPYPFNFAAAALVGVAAASNVAKIASVGGGGGGANFDAGGGGIAASPSTSTDLTQPQDLQRAEATTGVSVTIQGDVLDSDESGSRIVALINSAFDKKGVVINQGVMA